jgi:glutathione synthase/RimK-type ligase-like ATP-grasp enzyme
VTLPAKIAIATSAMGVEHDVDLPRLVDTMLAYGSEAQAVRWDSDQDWGAFDLVLIRSTWDYATRIAEFSQWVDGVSAETPLANPAEVLRWNLDKHYLQDLARAGIPVTPTRYLSATESLPVPVGDIVVKPVISAGARNTGRYRPEDHARAVEHVRMLHDEGQVAMVQPYLHEIDAEGERALVFLGGRSSHAVRKGAVLREANGIDNDRFPHPDLRSHTPSAAELEVASAALRAIPGAPGPLPYARVDLVPMANGRPRIMEVELIDPNLFLVSSEGAVSRFADAITEHLGAL